MSVAIRSASRGAEVSPPLPLRVLHITTSDSGGAGVACLRLHHALRAVHVDSRVLVNKRHGDDDGVVRTGSRWTAALRYRLDRLPLRLYPRKSIFASWSVNWLNIARSLKFEGWEPDILHAHWIGDGFLSVQRLAASGKPVVWTMHDMWPFTGGCHYSRDCANYEKGCGACPQLGSESPHDLSRRSAARKAQAWSRISGAVVSPSPWLADAARRSTVFGSTRIEVIPNGLDGNLFKPGDRSDARRQLGLKDDERVLLAGAVGTVKDERKGFGLLIQAIHACVASGGAEKWRLLVFGAETGPGQETVGIPVTYCGTVNDQRHLPRIYQAADVYTLPSLQDNLPNTVVEALACGTPVVAFRAGGLANMIADGITGRLAEPFSTQSLAAAICDAVAASMHNTWRKACREEFERVYALPGPAKQYLNLYKEMMQGTVR